MLGAILTHVFPCSGRWVEHHMSGLQGLGVEEAVRPVCSILHSALTCREQTLLSEEIGEVSVGRVARSACPWQVGK